MATATIPHLPVLVIHHVLQFLPTKLAIRMSSLCKQWEGLWSSVPVLDFDEEDEPDDRLQHAKFINFLDRCLAFPKKYEYLDKFRLRMTLFSDEDEKKVLECLQCDHIGQPSAYKPALIANSVPRRCEPHSRTLLDAKSLTYLNIECGRFWADNNDVPISLPSLKTLILRIVTLHYYYPLSSLISGCPCIQYLRLTGYLQPYYELSIQTLLDAKSLTSLSLERVKILPGDDNNDRKAVGPLSLKTMSLKKVILDDMTFGRLTSGSPCLEHLSVSLISDHIHIPRSSIKSLQVANINSTTFRVSGAKNLESFTLISECSTQIESIRLDCCKNLKYLNIRAPDLQEFTLEFNGRKDRVKATLDIQTLDYPIINFLGKESPCHGNMFLH
ncbi:putative F-box/FBD/LRR-repeat protein [Prunus yedoensis var. nudiflora]|uniref:Putative F-box/FBD/LRR-repeat protein n=1 Tax=Prunus yedoensis var. nudiflora TaxID=2094558 RepID=A0A314U888_PRUYE|nr:putative F-box/FBD/LRR-repeat protein [Prunus yedoensis var. nudiflora]